MKITTKKNILLSLTIIETILYCFYLSRAIVNNLEVNTLLACLFNSLLMAFLTITLLTNKKASSFYHLAFFFALGLFSSLTIENFLLMAIAMVVLLFPSVSEKGKLANIIKKYPFMAVVTVTLAGVAFLNSSSIFDHLQEQLYGFEMLGELLAALFVVFMIFVCKKEHILFEKQKSLKESIVVALPFILYIIYIACVHLSINILEGVPFLPLSNVIIIIIFYFLVGFFEDFLLRGLSLNILLDRLGNSKRGIWLSIVISSLLFGMIHFTNLSTGASFQGVLIQVLSATLIGIYFAAIYLRTGSVWVTALLHGVYDLAVSIPDLLQKEGIVDTIANYAENISAYSWASLLFSLIFLIMTIILLRKKKMQEVIALRNGETVVENPNDNLTKTVILILSVGLTLPMCCSLFSSMKILSDNTNQAYHQILTSNDYQKRYGLTFTRDPKNYETLSDEVKILLAISNLDKDGFVNEMTIQEAENSISTDSVNTYITKAVIDAKVEAIFGTKKDLQYVPVDVSYQTSCSYDSEQKQYICVTNNNSQKSDLVVYSDINKIIFNDESNIEVWVYYLVEDTKNKILYADSNLQTIYQYDETIEDIVGDIRYDFNDDHNTAFWQKIKEKKDGHVPTYRLIFKTDNSFEKVYFDSSELITDSIDLKNAIIEEKIADNLYKYSHKNYTFEYNKNYFDVVAEDNNLSLVHDGTTYLKIEVVDSDLWLKKYRSSVGPNVTYGDNSYWQNNNEYLIYKNDFYIISVYLPTTSVSDTLKSLQFKE